MAATKTCKSVVEIFKIDITICTVAETDFGFPGYRTPKFPFFVFRKFGSNKHWLIGEPATLFLQLLSRYKDLIQGGSVGGNTATGKEAIDSVNPVEYAKNDRDFELKLKTAEDANQLILLYLVENDNRQNYDGSVELLAKVNTNITVVKVNMAICKGAEKKFPDKEKTGIMSFPTLVVRKFGVNKDRIVDLDVIRLHLKILK